MGATDVTVGAAAVRSIGADVLSGTQVEVSISVSGLGEFGGVTETLPEGFVYLSSSFDGCRGECGWSDRNVRDHW